MFIVTCPHLFEYGCNRKCIHRVDCIHTYLLYMGQGYKYIHSCSIKCTYKFSCIYIYLQIYIFRNMNTVRIAYILNTYSDLKHDCMYILFLQLFTCLHILSVIHLHTVILKFTYTYHNVFFRIYANILYIFASTNIHIHRHMCIYIHIFICTEF